MSRNLGAIHPDKFNDPEIHTHFQQGIEFLERISQKQDSVDSASCLENVPGPFADFNKNGDFQAIRDSLENPVLGWHLMDFCFRSLMSFSDEMHKKPVTCTVHRLPFVQGVPG